MFSWWLFKLNPKLYITRHKGNATFNSLGIGTFSHLNDANMLVGQVLVKCDKFLRRQYSSSNSECPWENTIHLYADPSSQQCVSVCPSSPALFGNDWTHECTSSTSILTERVHGTQWTQTTKLITTRSIDCVCWNVLQCQPPTNPRVQSLEPVSNSVSPIVMLMMPPVPVCWFALRSTLSILLDLCRRISVSIFAPLALLIMATSSVYRHLSAPQIISETQTHNLVWLCVLWFPEYKLMETQS